MKLARSAKQAETGRTGETQKFFSTPSPVTRVSRATRPLRASSPKKNMTLVLQAIKFARDNVSGTNTLI